MPGVTASPWLGRSERCHNIRCFATMPQASHAGGAPCIRTPSISAASGRRSTAKRRRGKIRQCLAVSGCSEASFSYMGSRLCRRPPQKSLKLLVFRRFGGPGSGKKMLKFQDAFRRSILDTFWQSFTFFYRFFAARQARTYCNLQCFCAFGMKQVLLATC